MNALGGDHGGDSLLAAIVGMARSLELVTVAEGIEDLEQLKAFKRHGCENAQGFLLARPLAAADLEQQLRTLRVPDTAGAGAAVDNANPGLPA